MITPDPQTQVRLPTQIAASVPQLLSAITGGCIAFFGAWATNRASLRRQREQWSLEQKRERTLNLRVKGEELYILLHYWSSHLSGHYITMSMAMQGKLTFNQVLDFDIEHGKEFQSKYEAPRIELFIITYFNSCSMLHKELMTEVHNLNAIESRFKRSYEAGSLDGSSYLSEYVQAQKQFERKLQELQRGIIGALQAL